MQSHFLLVGSRKKSYTESALQAGAKISLLISADQYKDEYQSLFHRVLKVADIYDWQQVKEVIDQSERIEAVLTRFENYVSVVGAINQYLGLQGIDYQTSRNFCNKYSMKQVWLKAGVACADGICLNSLDQLDGFLAKHTFPLMLKKTSATHSNFVVKVKSKKDLFEQLDFLKSRATGYVTSSPVKGYGEKLNECHFLLEEMLGGRELTVDTFVSGGKFVHTPICEYVMAQELAINDSYLPIRMMPTILTMAQEKLVYATVEKALTALLAKNCVCHTEIFFDEKNNHCTVIESTPRSGGNRAEMANLTTGYDYNLSVFKAASDMQIEAVAQPTRAICVVEYFAEKKGVIEDIDLDFLSQCQAVSNIKIRYDVGSTVEQAKFGGKTLVNFYVEANDPLACRQLAIQLFRQVRQSIRIN
jgi:biotin carboxylase